MKVSEWEAKRRVERDRQKAERQRAHDEEDARKATLFCAILHDGRDPQFDWVYTDLERTWIEQYPCDRGDPILRATRTGAEADGTKLLAWNFGHGTVDIRPGNEV